MPGPEGNRKASPVFGWRMDDVDDRIPGDDGSFSCTEAINATGGVVKIAGHAFLFLVTIQNRSHFNMPVGDC